VSSRAEGMRVGEKRMNRWGGKEGGGAADDSETEKKGEVEGERWRRDSDTWRGGEERRGEERRGGEAAITAELETTGRGLDLLAPPLLVFNLLFSLSFVATEDLVTRSRFNPFVHNIKGIVSLHPFHRHR